MRACNCVIALTQPVIFPFAGLVLQWCCIDVLNFGALFFFFYVWQSIELEESLYLSRVPLDCRRAN